MIILCGIATLIISSFSFKINLEPHILPNDFTLEHISYVFKSIPFNLPTLSICLGMPNTQCFNLAISTSNSDTIIETIFAKEKHFNHQFDNTLSSTYDNKTISTSLGFPLFGTPRYYFTGNLALDVISLHGESPLKGLFCFIEAKGTDFSPINIDGYLGMKEYFYSSRSDHMFIDLLYENQRIDKRAFAISYYNQGGGTIILGSNTTDYNTCSSINFKDNWYCNVTEINMGELSMPLINERPLGASIAKFKSMVSSIIAPNDDGIKILHKIIEIAEGKCIIENKSMYMYLICDKMTKIEQFPMLKIKLNMAELVLNWKDMMKKTDCNNKEKYVSLLIVQKDETKNWNIGTPAFIDHSIYFDIDNQVIGIKNPSKFSYNGINPINHSFNRIICFILIVLCIIIFFGISLIILVIMKFKNL